jgi:hypothetical protein
MNKIRKKWLESLVVIVHTLNFLLTESVIASAVSKVDPGPVRLIPAILDDAG